MKRVFLKIIVIFSSLVFASCSINSLKNEEPRIRIVDLEGKPHSVVTKVPDLNAEALVKQGKLRERSPIISQIPEDRTRNSQQRNLVKNQPNQDFGAASSQIMQETLQSPQSPQFKQRITAASQEDSMTVSEVQEIQYDLSEGGLKPEPKSAEVTNTSAKKYVIKSRPNRVKPKASSDDNLTVYSQNKKGLYVQVGSFSSASNAKRRMEKIQEFHSGRIEEVQKTRTIYRVLLGPFASKSQADSMLKKVKKSGYAAVLVRNR